MGIRSARRIFSLVLGISALLFVSSCAVIPLFEVDAINVQVDGSGLFTGLFVTFRATFDNADLYEWDFGDGGTGFGQIVTHTYSTSGLFTVTLRVTNNGNTFTYSKEVDISAGDVVAAANDIVFECGNGTSADDLCGINLDGSSFQILLEESATINGIEHPDINANGQVVFQCRVSPGFEDSLCGINSDGSGFRVIQLDAAGQLFRRPKINDSGQIVFDCLSTVTFFRGICVVDFDGNSFNMIDDPASTDDESRDPVINNSGQIAYECENTTATDNLCVNDFAGSGRVVRDTNLSVSGFVDPSINNSGQIAYVCGNAGPHQSICVINYNGTGQNRITDPANFNDEDITPIINDSGQISYDCENDLGSSFNSLCVIEFSGSNQAVIDQANNDQDEARKPVINSSGTIVYECQLNLDISSLCAINFNGSGFTILRNSLGDSNMTSIDPAVGQ